MKTSSDPNFPLVPKLHLGTALVPREISFRANLAVVIASKLAMKLRRQVRSQVQLGSEGMNKGLLQFKKK